MATDSKGQLKLELLDMKVVSQNLKDLKTFLDKACRAGTYDLEESSQVHGIMQNLTRVAINLDTLQKLVVDNAREAESRQESDRNKEEVPRKVSPSQ